jgi:hypothetical protein
VQSAKASASAGRTWTRGGSEPRPPAALAQARPPASEDRGGPAQGRARTVGRDPRARAVARLPVQGRGRNRVLQHARPRAGLPRRRRGLPGGASAAGAGRRDASALAPLLSARLRLAPDRQGPERRLRLPPARPRQPDRHPLHLRPTCSSGPTTPPRRAMRWRQATRRRWTCAPEKPMRWQQSACGLLCLAGPTRTGPCGPVVCVSSSQSI